MSSKGKKRGFALGWLGLALLLPFVAGAIGSAATFSQITGWYATLAKPSWNPPAALFGPVWTLLYLMIGVATYYYWRSADKKTVGRGTLILLVQLVFNTLWSLVFFGAHDLNLAVAVIAILWLLIVWNITEFWQVHRGAGALLVPYLLWVSFAGVLNYAVALLN